MARPWWARTFALAAGLWFTVMTVVPEGVHACPSHTNAADATASAASQSGHGHHGAAPASQETQHGNEHCTCVGQCCVSAPIALASRSIELQETLAASTRDNGLPDHEYAPVAAQHVLPFALAPPIA